MIRFSLVVDRADSLVEYARRADDLGFWALYVPDHPGVSADPFGLLGAAAAVTSRVRLGTYVVNTGVRDALTLASGAATVDALSGGRFVLGLGAGHTPSEWTMLGRRQPDAAGRVTRLEEMVDVVPRLLAGETVTHQGETLHLDRARLDEPRPVQEQVPLLVGGNGARVLRLAGQRAEIVGMSGLGRTLADGHRHTAEWSAAAIDGRVQIVRDAARGRREPPVLDALVQHVELTDQPRDAAERVAGVIEGLTPDELLGAPYALVGSIDSIAEELARYREQWGFTSYVVRARAIDAVASIIERVR